MPDPNLAAEVAVVRCEIVRRRGPQPLLLSGGHGQPQRRHDAPRQAVLQHEPILQRLLEPVRPQLVARRGVDQLHIDPHAVLRDLHAAFHHGVYAQVSNDVPEALHRTPVLSHRAARGYP